MISNNRIFFLGIAAPLVEGLLFVFYFAIIGYVKVCLAEKDILLPKSVLNLWIGVFLFYLLISNAIIPSFCGLLFNFKLESKRRISIIISNIVWYGLSAWILYFQIVHSQSPIYYIFVVLYVMDLGACFLKKTNTRLIYYILNIKVLQRREKRSKD